MLQIHHFRNATMVIETENDVILVDPMLGDIGTLPAFAFFRFKARKNPIVPLPKQSKAILDKVTHCLITHLHPDHLDKDGIAFLKNKQIPVTCSIKDGSTLKKKGLNVVQQLEYWKEQLFLGGTIKGTTARHGYGFVAKPAGNVMGFFIQLPNQKSIYLSSDTIYTDDVHRVLTQFKPDISVVAAGSAQFDLFKPLLMTIDDILKFIKTAPGKVIANHMEAVNHCPTARVQLQQEVDNLGLTEKVFIPNDGAEIAFD